MLEIYFFCINDRVCLRVRYIQKRKPLVLNYLYVFLLKNFDVKVECYPLKNTSNNYKNIFNKVSQCVDKVIPATNTNVGKLDVLIKQKIGQHYFVKVWRLFSIICFLDSKSENSENVYIGVNLPKSAIKKVRRFLVDENFSTNIFLYKSFAVSDESNFLYKTTLALYKS